MATPNADFASSLAALTFDLVAPDIVDNITDMQVLLWDLKRRGYQDVRDGGYMIDYIVELSENTTAAPYADGGLIDLSTQEPFTRARYDWKYYAVSTAITGPTEFRNRGDRTQIASLIEGLVDNAEKSLRLRVNADLYGTGSDGVSITGLALAVEDGAAWSTYGGINSGASDAASQRWRNQFLGSVGSFASNGRAKLTELINNCTKRGQYPTLGITTQTVHQYLEKLLTAQATYEMMNSKDEAMAKAGFKHLVFKGVPIVWDTDCTADSIYILNSNGLRFVVGNNKDFASTDFQRPDNQDAKSNITLLYCNLATKARYLQGVMNGITA